MPDFEFEVNGNGLQPLNPITTAESHSSFVDYKTKEESPDDYGGFHMPYAEYDTTTVLLHKSSISGTYGLVIMHNDASGDGNSGYGIRTEFSQALQSTSGFVAKDDFGPDNPDKYSNASMDHTFGNNSTDGALIDISQFSDVNITVNNNSSFDRDSIGDFRIIHQDGAPPDGGAATYAGYSGSIRIVVPDGVRSISGDGADTPTEGGQVVMLRSDLAIF